jgi:predicted DNA-binding protein
MGKLLIKLHPEMNKRLNAYARLKQKEKKGCIVEALENFLEAYEDILLSDTQQKNKPHRKKK